ncbi:MAG TPA: ABC transporter substrate-binding protein [Chloroflexota bacterium]|nr:ABC transporter substrate-binding protein [Chloroflexota bacterium]
MGHLSRFKAYRSAFLPLLATMALSIPALGASAPRHPAAGPVYGGTLRTAFSDGYTFLDPAEASGSDSITLYYTMFDGLYKYDRTGQPQLDLAAAPPTVSADRKTWTFTLRKNVVFSNGMPMTADDVKYSMLRMLDPHLGPPVSYCQSSNDIYVGSHAYILGKSKDVPGIQVLDPYTIRFVLTQPTAILPYFLAVGCNFVVPKAVASKETESQFSNHPIGTGPFMLQSYQKGVQATFVKNPHYFIPGRPYLDKVITYLNIPPSVIALKIQHGDIDAFADAIQIATPDLQQFMSDPKLRSYVVQSTPWVSIWIDINGADPLMKSLKLRQAIAMAIDRKRLVKLDGGNATPAYQLYEPAFPQYDPTLANHAVYPYDPVKAAALVKASGYKGQELVYMDRSGVPYFQAIAPGIQQELQQIGLNVSVKTVSNTTYHVDRESLTNHEMDGFDWGIDYYDASDLYSYTLDCAQNGDGGFSGAHYCDRRADALAHKAQTLPLGATRNALLRQAQMIILQSATRIPLLYPKNIEIASPRIGGFYYQPTIGLQYEVYWLKK